MESAIDRKENLQEWDKLLTLISAGCDSQDAPIITNDDHYKTDAKLGIGKRRKIPRRDVTGLWKTYADFWI